MIVLTFIGLIGLGATILLPTTPKPRAPEPTGPAAAAAA